MKDIIGERKILEREKLYRVNVFAYVAAKAITNGLLGLPIVLVASGILFLTGSLTDQNQFLPLFFFGSMVFFASSNTSLAISAIPFGSIEKTLYIAFFLILLQIILSGVIIPDINRAVSWLFLANWGTIAAADLVEIDRFCQKWKDACGNSLYSNYNSVQEIWRYLVMAIFPLGVAYILCKLTFRERK